MGLRGSSGNEVGVWRRLPDVEYVNIIDELQYNLRLGRGG